MTKKQREVEDKCSFCNKKISKVRIMISTPEKFKVKSNICGNCVVDCVNVMNKTYHNSGLNKCHS